MIKCDICGTKLTQKNDKGEDILISALRMPLDDDQEFHSEFKRIKKMFGKTTFTICYPCWLKSLGVKVVK